MHRDLKPENVLIQHNGVAKLTDFGLARSLSARLTNEGMITGTVFYIAPELALGQPFDGRADLYALGVMLYELVAGRTPFTADDPLAVISQHIHAPVVPPSAYRPDLSPAIEAVILKLLAKAPEDRYPNAQATLQALSDAELGVFPAEQLSPRALSDVLLEKLARGRMVGRRDELDTLHQMWKLTLTGQAHLALISGEPGIGKTRLANEIQVYRAVERGGGAARRLLRIRGCHALSAVCRGDPRMGARAEHRRAEGAPGSIGGRAGQAGAGDRKPPGDAGAQPAALAQ